MKTLMIFAALLTMTSTAFASTILQQDTTSVDVGSYASKTAAYQAGYQYIEQLKNMDQSELKFKVAPVSGSMIGPIQLNSTQVQLQEFSNEPGQVQYKTLVNVSYQYKEHDDK